MILQSTYLLPDLRFSVMVAKKELLFRLFLDPRHAVSGTPSLTGEHLPPTLDRSALAGISRDHLAAC